MKQSSVKVFRGRDVTVTFTYSAAGAFPLVVDINEVVARGPRMARLDRDETREFYQWLKALMEPAEAAQSNT